MEFQKEISALTSKSDSKLKTAKINFESGQHEDAVSCSYYAVFHIITACLLTKKLVFSSHSQVIGAFNKEFIKTGIFTKEFSKIIQNLFEDRQSSDYDAYFKVDKDAADYSIKKAEMIINTVKEYLAKSQEY